MNIRQQEPFCRVPSGTHTQWLLLQDQENGVKQLKVLREVVELLHVSISSCLVATSENIRSRE
jgi:hypothetical protein